ncbi:PspA/IM30 family protein [Bacillus niameyensis]|uniref:PspA/IM30 family protein n=1 Tax=Bacillus niameyensis TaxID=1522308 RepID=UPI00078520EA|nr:PspA/IM30 family protein [Bacillus niameyensis]
MNQFFEKVKSTIMSDLQTVSEVATDKKDPVSLLNKYLRESEAEVTKAEKLIERQRILTEEFKKELKLAQDLADKRREQGKIAMNAGAEDLAEIALRYQAQAEEQVERLTRSYETAIEQLSELEQKHEEMKLKVKDMHFKRMELMGQENVLSMKEKMNKLLDETEFGETADRIDTLQRSMKQQENDMDDEYAITIFDAKVKEIAKEMSRSEKVKIEDENVVQ